MPAVTGRTSEGRTIASVATTSSSSAITAPSGSFNEEDAGRAITGAGIPAAATLLSVTSSTAATLSAAASASATVTATLGDAGDRYGFRGWSPESDAQSEVYSIAGGAGAADPAKIPDSVSSEIKRYWRA